MKITPDLVNKLTSCLEPERKLLLLLAIYSVATTAWIFDQPILTLGILIVGFLSLSALRVFLRIYRRRSYINARTADSNFVVDRSVILLIFLTLPLWMLTHQLSVIGIPSGAVLAWLALREF